MLESGNIHIKKRNNVGFANTIVSTKKKVADRAAFPREKEGTMLWVRRFLLPRETDLERQIQRWEGEEGTELSLAFIGDRMLWFACSCACRLSS